MNIAKLTFAALAVSASAIPVSAHAALLLFDLSGGRNVSFQLDSNPTPDGSQSFLGEQAVFSNVAGTVNGSPTTIDTISFGTGVFADSEHHCQRARTSPSSPAAGRSSPAWAATRSSRRAHSS